MTVSKSNRKPNEKPLTLTLSPKKGRGDKRSEYSHREQNWRGPLRTAREVSVLFLYRRHPAAAEILRQEAADTTGIQRTRVSHCRPRTSQWIFFKLSHSVVFDRNVLFYFLLGVSREYEIEFSLQYRSS